MEREEDREVLLRTREREIGSRSSEGETLRFEISAVVQVRRRGNRESECWELESCKGGRKGKLDQQDQPIYRVSRKTREKAKETDF